MALLVYIWNGPSFFGINDVGLYEKKIIRPRTVYGIRSNGANYGLDLKIPFQFSIILMFAY